MVLRSNRVHCNFVCITTKKWKIKYWNLQLSNDGFDENEFVLSWYFLDFSLKNINIGQLNPNAIFCYLFPSPVKENRRK